jgi:phospholipid/cholesterol/gamma-HCH transport system permease protein
MNGDAAAMGANPMLIEKAPGLLRRGLFFIGTAPFGALRALLRATGAAVTVAALAVNPSTWHRTVRAELVRQIFLIGVGGLPSVMFTGLLVGLVMVTQVVYWLSLAGETGAIGGFVVPVLVGSTAPVLVGILVIGRSGMLMLTEIGNMQARGQLHMLNARGIAPFVYVLVPRVVATTVSLFCLSMAFIIVALIGGFVAGNAAGLSTLGFAEFIKEVLGAMGPADYAILPVKTMLIGFLIAVIACLTGLEAEASAESVRRLLPRCFVRSMLATLIVSITLSVLF